MIALVKNWQRLGRLGHSVSGGFASRPWLVVPIASAAHFTYWAAILYSAGVGKITAAHLLTMTIGAISAAWIFLAVGLFAISPMFIRMRAEYIHLCLWPQQTVLFISTASVLNAIFRSQFPDGYPSTWNFIAADQCLTIYLTVAHFAATLRNALLGRQKR